MSFPKPGSLTSFRTSITSWVRGMRHWDTSIRFSVWKLTKDNTSIPKNDVWILRPTSQCHKKKTKVTARIGHSFLHRCELLFASPSCDTSLLRPVSGSDCQSGSHYGRSGRAMALCCYQTSNCHSPTRAAGAMANGANGPLQAQRRRTAQTHGSHWRRQTHYPWKNQKCGERSMYWISLASLAISVSGFIQKPIDAGSMLRKKDYWNAFFTLIFWGSAWRLSPSSSYVASCRACCRSQKCSCGRECSCDAQWKMDNQVGENCWEVQWQCSAV